MLIYNIIRNVSEPNATIIYFTFSYVKDNKATAKHTKIYKLYRL